MVIADVMIAADSGLVDVMIVAGSILFIILPGKLKSNLFSYFNFF